MRHILTTISLLVALMLGMFSEAQQALEKSPKQVAEEFWKFEINGGRLSPDGWKKASIFFMRPSPPPPQRTLVVLGPGSSVWDPEMENKTTANIIVGESQICTIGPKMQYTRSKPESAKEGILFKLVFSDKHWKLGADGKTLEAVNGPAAWRIEKSGDTGIVWVNLDTAIGYVQQTAEKTTDPAIRQNAQRALAFLKRQLRQK